MVEPVFFLVFAKAMLAAKVMIMGRYGTLHATDRIDAIDTTTLLFFILRCYLFQDTTGKGPMLQELSPPHRRVLAE